MNELLSLPVEELSIEQLDGLVRHLNDEYRKGQPLVSDNAFDHVYLKALRERDPENDFFVNPQPEPLTAKGRIAHGERRMLSTDKAYTLDEVQAWVKRCESAAVEIGVDPASLRYRLTPKLDGLAGRFDQDSGKLISRGDGEFGNDWSHLLELGLVFIGPENGHSVGEIIMLEQYYQDNLQEHFPHPRNLVAGIANADELNEHGAKALQEGVVHFVIYDSIDAKEVSAEALVAELDQLVEEVVTNSAYRLDGVVIEITDDAVKQHMGSTSHHHSWQIAKKQRGETALTEVADIIWQVSRTGRINPVINVKDTYLDGCTIKRVTGHHARNMVNHRIGVGAKIEIERAGSVIPAFVKTHEGSDIELPTQCPCCHHPLEWSEPAKPGEESLHLMCYGPACSAQAITHIENHFKKIQADLFGPKTVEKLVEAGYDTIEKIYQLSVVELMGAGFGPGQAKNLVDEMLRVKREPLRDFLLLGSLGIQGLGRGNSRKLLAQHCIEDVLTLSSDDLLAIQGFGDITSVSVVKDLAEIASTLQFLMDQGFNLTHSKEESENAAGGPLAGLNLVFTGKMAGSRDDMEEQAKAAGGNVQKSVSGKTNLLVCGANVGDKKTSKAASLGVEVIEEADYMKRFFT